MSEKQPSQHPEQKLEQVVDALAERQKRIAQLEAEQQQLLAEAGLLADEIAELCKRDTDKQRRSQSCAHENPCADPEHCDYSFPVPDLQTTSRLDAYAQIGAKLRVTDRTVARWAAHAETLTEHYPATQHSLSEGKISKPHTVAICDAGLIITDEKLRARFEEIVLPYAEKESVNRVREFARRVAERFTDQPLDERAPEARLGREVTLKPLEDDLALLSAVLPLAEATATMDRLSHMARQVWRENRRARARQSRVTFVSENEAADAGWPMTRTELAATDHRTMAQIRADLLMDLLLTGTPAGHGDTDCCEDNTDGQPCQCADDNIVDAHSEGADTVEEFDPANRSQGKHFNTNALAGVTAHIQVVIPLMSLLPEEHLEKLRKIPEFAHIEALSGMNGTPYVVGQGPMSTETAKFLAGSAPGWDRMLTHPVTGMVEHVDRYQPTDSLKRYLRARDEHCRFPGCRMPARRCEIDHTVDWALGGKTTHTNLAHLCPRHHRLKHHSDWKVKQLPGGVLEWTSPAGEIYPDRPTSQLAHASLLENAETLKSDTTPPPF